MLGPANGVCREVAIMESAGVGTGIGAGSNGTIRGAFVEAAKFWEPRRVIYNLVLALVVVAWVGFSWPHFRPMFHWKGLLFLVVMALLANACYCAAYVVEFAMQGSPISSGWRRWRWGLWALGMLLALVMENYWIADEVYPFVR